MYRTDLDTKDRSGVALAVIAVHLALALALLNLSGHLTVAGAQQALRVFDIREIPPPPPPPPPVVQQQARKPQPKTRPAPAAPKNIKSESTPVVAPPPRILLPTPPRIAVSETPRQGTQSTQGASDVRGPGTGAGGAGTGTGSGGAGTGSGRGGDGGGIAAGPQLVSPKLASRDFPPEIIRIWPRGGAVYVAMRVQTDGRATDCRVDRSVGNPVIDAWTCRLVETRLRFRPAVNQRGEPIVSWFGYIQREIGR